MPKLRSAGRVRTNTLLGHNTDQTPPYSFSFLRLPFSNTTTILSRFLLVHTSLEHLQVLDGLSLQRTLFDTNTANPSSLQAPTDTYEHSMAHYRAMRNCFRESAPNRLPAAAAIRTPFGTAAKLGEAGAKRATILCSYASRSERRDRTDFFLILRVCRETE